MEAKINKLRELALSKRFILRITFKNLRYSLILGKTVIVEDKTSGSMVRWNQAFGNRSLSDVLNSFQIESISLEKGSELELFEDVDKALAYLEKI